MQRNLPEKYYRNSRREDVRKERKSIKRVSRIEGIIIYRELPIVLFDGCIVELRAFVTANGAGSQCVPFSLSPPFFVFSFSNRLIVAALSIVLSPHTLRPSLRANRFDSCLANESTFPPNRQNKSTLSRTMSMIS